MRRVRVACPTRDLTTLPACENVAISSAVEPTGRHIGPLGLATIATAALGRPAVADVGRFMERPGRLAPPRSESRDSPKLLVLARVQINGPQIRRPDQFLFTETVQCCRVRELSFSRSWGF
jgi:hypothetical protein